MRAGRLRERIDLYREVSTTDSDYGSQENTFELYDSTRADVKPLNGAELLMNETVSNTTSVQFIIRWKESITETMQIEYRGDRYNIEYIEENRKNKMIKITASKILN